MLYILNRDFEVVAVANNIGQAMPYYGDTHTQNLEAGTSSFEFTIPSNHEMSAFVTEGNYVVRTDLDGNKLLFTIMEIDENHGEISEKIVYCEDGCLELLNTDVEPYTETSPKDIQYYINKTIAGTGVVIGYCDVGITRTLEFTEYENALERLISIVNQFDNAEMSFSYELNGSYITKKYINIQKQRGTNNGKRFTFSKDLTSVRRKVDMSNVATALRGIGKADDNEVRTTFKDLTYDDGDIYTTKGSEYLYCRSSLEKWGKQGNNIKRKFEYETSSASELLNRAISDIKERKEPLVTYETEVVLLERLAGYSGEQVRIGDTIQIIDTKFPEPLLLEARVVSMETSYTDPSQDKVTLGNYKIVKSDISAELLAMKSKLMQKEASWNQAGITAQEALSTAESKAQTFITTPSIPYSVGDIYKNGQSTYICTTDNPTGSYNSNDWTLSGDVTSQNKAADTSKVNGTDASTIVTYATNGNSAYQDTTGWKVDGKTTIDGANIETGTLTFDKARGGTLQLGGINDTYGSLLVLGADGEVIADLDAEKGGFDSLYVGKLYSKSVPNYNDENLTLYVDPINGDDSYSGSSWSGAKKTIQKAIDLIPKYNNGNITIYCHYDNSRNMYESIDITGFVGSGVITIDGQTWSNTLTGSIVMAGCTNSIFIKNLTINSTNGKAFEAYKCSYVYGEKIMVYGQNSGRCFYADNGTNMYLYLCEGYDAAFIIYAMTLGRVLVRDCKGYGTQRGLAGQYGAEIKVTGTYPTGATTPTYFDSGANMIGTGTANSGLKGTVPVVKQTNQWSTTTGSNWGAMYGWESGLVKQGDYGFSQRTGFYNFGTTLSSVLQGKSISSMRVWVQRKSQGGSSGDVPMYIRYHNYTSQPTGQPTMSSAFVTLNLSWGESGWVTLPSSFLTAFSNGTAKGIGIWANSTNRSYYSIMTNTCTVEATYS